MTEQLRRPTEQVEVYWFSEQPNGYISDEDLNKYDSGRLGFPNTHFDPEKAHVLYNEYHEQYALADEVGFDGIMTNEHHAAYWCMKPCVNLDAAVIAKLTKRAKIAILWNVIAHWVCPLPVDRQRVQPATKSESANVVDPARSLNNNFSSQPAIKKNITAHEEAVIAVGHCRNRPLILIPQERIVIRRSHSQIAAPGGPVS